MGKMKWWVSYLCDMDLVPVVRIVAILIELQEWVGFTHYILKRSRVKQNTSWVKHTYQIENTYRRWGDKTL